MGKQTQKFVNEPVYLTVLQHNFDTPVSLAVNTGTFPATGDKVALAAANVSKVMSPFGLGVTAGDISLDDANDRILLEPGVYEVVVEASLQDAGTDSNFSFALTTAAQAANDVSLASIAVAVLTAGQQYQLSIRRQITVTSARALELHLAAVTSSGAISMRAGSFIRVQRLGNVE